MAKVAWVWMELLEELGLLSRAFLAIRNFLLEKREKGIGNRFVVVLAVGGERRSLVLPKKLEESKGLVVVDEEAIGFGL